MKNITTIIGARPQFIKAAPVCIALKKAGLKEVLIHTGQHYDKNMSDVFFEDLDIQKPDFMLNVGSGTQSYQTGKIMEMFEDVCLKLIPDLIIVFGDINSTLACSIVAKKLKIKLAHVEAGLRSYDRDMPEEINRLATDAISDYFFVTEENPALYKINKDK